MTKDHWKINIDNTSTEGAGKNGISEVKKELENQTEAIRKEPDRWRKLSVYKLPPSVTVVSHDAYMPQMLSIGPYHHGEKQLEDMEEHKLRARLHFLNRSGKTLETYFEALVPMAGDLMDAYDKLDDKWRHDMDKFLQLMILDGCFILELFRATNYSERYDPIRRSYADNDPVFGKHGKLYFVPHLVSDILLLENQIPMQVLTTLLLVEDRCPRPNEITELILKFFAAPMYVEPTTNCLHILDAYRRSLIAIHPDRLNKLSSEAQRSSDPRGYENIFCTAVELTEAGVRIEASRTTSLQDISFNKSSGVLKLPCILMDDTVESKYRNMMALERFNADAGSEVTSYVSYMDRIIDSAKDVCLLRSCGVMHNILGSDEAVAVLFNSLTKCITPDPDSRLETVRRQVADYAQKPLHRWVAYARHNYFTNPLVTTSVVAAALLFLLTFLQTLYTIIGHYKKGGASQN